jgi:hypothetical protein
MKLVIEIPDEALRNAVQAQIGIALSTMTREHIEAEAKTIISTAMQRVDWTRTAEREARSLLKDKIENAISEVLGNQSYQRREAVRKIINEVALQALKDGAK